MSEINHWYELVAFVVLGVGFIYLLYGNYMARKVCHTMHESMVAMLDRIKALEDQAYLRAPYRSPRVDAPPRDPGRPSS